MVTFIANLQKNNLLIHDISDYSEEELANKDIFENFVVAGWGKTLWNHSEPWTDQMQKLNLDFIDCKEAYRRRRNSHTCASGEKYISDSCKGDSGGPLMGINLSNYTGQTEAVGITSIGSRKCNSYRPAVHTKVGNFLDWINEFIIDAITEQST